MACGLLKGRRSEAIFLISSFVTFKFHERRKNLFTGFLNCPVSRTVFPVYFRGVCALKYNIISHFFCKIQQSFKQGFFTEIAPVYCICGKIRKISSGRNGGLCAEFRFHRLSGQLFPVVVLGKSGESMVTARAFSPSASKARAARVVLSTPPENAMTALSLAFIASFIISIFSTAINIGFSANKIYVFASLIVSKLYSSRKERSISVLK